MVVPEIMAEVEAEVTNDTEAAGTTKTMPVAGTGKTNAAWPAIEELVRVRMPGLRASYGLDVGAAACESDGATACTRIRSALASYDGKTALPDWVLEQARLAVEENLVEALRSGEPCAARLHCHARLAEAVAHYHRSYFLAPDVALRDRHTQEAERLLDERLAEYDGTVSFHRFIRQIAHLEGVERRGMHGLADWLDSLAKSAVERYVVEHICRDHDSPLAMVNLCWVAQRVCQWYKVSAGEIIDPRADNEVIWARLLESVPAALHEPIKDHSSTINARILRGLPRFKFASSFDTWRTAIVMNTMASISKAERKRQRETPLYGRQRHDDDEGPEQPLPIADGRQDLGQHAALADARAIMEEVLRVVFGGSETVRVIVKRRIEGYEAKEIEEECGVNAKKVHHIFSRFREECRRRYHEHDDDASRGDRDSF